MCDDNLKQAPAFYSVLCVKTFYKGSTAICKTFLKFHKMHFFLFLFKNIMLFPN